MARNKDWVNRYFMMEGISLAYSKMIKGMEEEDSISRMGQ